MADHISARRRRERGRATIVIDRVFLRETTCPTSSRVFRNSRCRLRRSSAYDSRFTEYAPIVISGSATANTPVVPRRTKWHRRAWSRHAAVTRPRRLTAQRGAVMIGQFGFNGGQPMPLVTRRCRRRVRLG